MSPIKDFKLIYETLNQEGTFSEGDTIIGTVSLKLTKDTKVKSFKVKVKGEAHVHWTEGTGDRKKSHSSHRIYLKVKESLVAEKDEGTVLPEGDHSFKFRLQIPQGDMPSSFKGYHGRIVYALQAKISRSWRMPSTEQKEIKFLSKSLPHSDQMMYQQSGSVNKEMGKFTSGEVQMSATVSKKVCSPGDTLSIVAKICNSSSKEMRPKFSIDQRVVYHAHASKTYSYKNLAKVVGDTIAPNSQETASCQLMIPADVVYSLHNCELITVEYTLKVYLDIKFATDPTILFPLIIVRPGSATIQPGGPVGPYPPGAAGGPSYSDFPSPAFPPVPPGSGVYGYPAPDPTQYANMTSGYSNQWPQNAPAYGFSSAAFSPPTVQHPVPTAPPQFQQGGGPPAYVSLYPPFNDPYGSSGSDQKR
ncbi:arrestin domain-containing protein 3-like [Brachyistius frenatus]|uniref:arrestin domain-containing protein 3-like n=1 Tax=Brachyistius frenatus TaxID=100188 RepID=UPI0037E92344